MFFLFKIRLNLVSNIKAIKKENYKNKGYLISFV